MAQVIDPQNVQFLDFEDTRDLRYCELFVVGPEWVDILNSIGLSDAPLELWDRSIRQQPPSNSKR